MSVLVERILQRVLEEELPEDELVKQVGRIVRGESMSTTYRFKEDGTKVPVSERKTRLHGDQMRGLQVVNRLKQQALLGKDGETPLSQEEGLRAFLPMDDPEELTWRSKAAVASDKKLLEGKDDEEDEEA